MARGMHGSRQAAWEFFGAELKRRREEAPFTQVELGSRVFVSGGYIGQFEQAIRKPQLDVAQRIDAVLQTDGFFERMWRKLIKDKRYAEYFEAVVELERMATRIYEFEPMIVPGLLQTPAYATAIMRAGNWFAADEYIADKVKSRLERADILKDAARPVYWVVLHESVLRVPVGGSATMAEQLEHIAALVGERVVLVQVLPFAEGAFPVMGKMMKIMEFDDAPPTAYTEGAYLGSLVDDPSMVQRAREAYDLIKAASLSPEASLPLIESAAEDYRRCTSTN
ncbi:helix-turn-helix transcriptional regulator [Streptomyces sp. NPDC017941]|uniref:helix-turn-helix domain-containing protein n=1 Tax=unclassified Streptomyces TaxID=2593676 RepID=UPI0037BD789F